MEKQWEMRTTAEPNKIYISLESFVQNVTFIEFEPLCQKLWPFMSSFTMTTHRIWSCHVTLGANLETFYFSPNSVQFYVKF